MFDREGNLFFTHGRFVSRVTPGGRQEVWTETEGANGHKVLPDGTHLLCAPGEAGGAASGRRREAAGRRVQFV